MDIRSRVDVFVSSSIDDDDLVSVELVRFLRIQTSMTNMIEQTSTKNMIGTKIEKSSEIYNLNDN